MLGIPLTDFSCDASIGFDGALLPSTRIEGMRNFPPSLSACHVMICRR
jgi:hypothetical protein